MKQPKEPDFKETVCLQQYRGSINSLRAHIQILDASLLLATKTLKKDADQEQHIHKALDVPAEKYNYLNHPVKQHHIIILHAQKKNIEFGMLRIYNLFTAYLQNITREMFVKKPMLVVGKAVLNKNGDDKDNLSMSYAEIIRLGNFENIQDQIVLKIFRGIEELRSTSKLLDKILRDTKVNIPMPLIEKALTYLEMRHLFVHNHGKIDHKYAKDFGNRFTPKLVDGKSLPTKYEIFENAIIAVTALVTTIDSQLVASGMVEKRKFKAKDSTASL